MRTPLVRHAVAAIVAVAAGLGAGDGVTAQGPAFDWRMTAGVGITKITSSHRHGAASSTATRFSVGLHRAIGNRYALGLEWSGVWYESLRGDEQRQSLTLTGLAYPVRGLFVSAGVGPGLASLLEISSDPGNLGDDMIDFHEGESALVLTGAVGYDLRLWDGLLLTPLAEVMAHRLRGETYTQVAVGARVGVGAGGR